jgi:hypothetical protein
MIIKIRYEGDNTLKLAMRGKVCVRAIDKNLPWGSTFTRSFERLWREENCILRGIDFRPFTKWSNEGSILMEKLVNYLHMEYSTIP